jgi:hypothetical protein
LDAGGQFCEASQEADKGMYFYLVRVVLLRNESASWLIISFYFKGTMDSQD